MPNAVAALYSGALRACASIRSVLTVTAAVSIAAVPWTSAHAQVGVSASGLPGYSAAIKLPPGIAGMTPNLGLAYSGGGVNGPVGYGWSIQGISTITRCPNTKAIDGSVRGVDYTANDKLCLDGQRLIQSDATGTPTPQTFPQTNDSLGGTGQVLEYRTEKDTFARIRSYGSAGGTAANGPAYFKVWTKSGQVYEYGNNANATANAAIAVTGKTAISAWAVSRISDTLGNYIDFQYEQRDVAWGSGPVAGSPTLGHEWNLLEVRYTGTSAQQPVNKVVFEYLDRPDTTGFGQDRAEAYQQGSKNVSVRRLNAVRTYINWPADAVTMPATAVKVKAIKITYDQGPVSKRSRVTQIAECVGVVETTCTPPTIFNYAPGGNESFTANTAFGADPVATLDMKSATGTSGAMLGDFNGDGRTDILYWSDTPVLNKLYLSNGDGSFTSAGLFNLTTQNLFTSNQCYFSIAADFNADGVTDILRIMRATSATGTSCGTLTNLLLQGNGDGSFTQVTLPAGISLTQQTSVTKDYYDCLLPKSSTYLVNCSEPGNTYLGTSMSAGANFHIIDADGDGIPDLITSIIPGFSITMAPPSEATQCATIVCTHVYKGSAAGAFTELTNTNLAHRSVYAAPPRNYWEYFRKPYVADINGDGLSDLLVDSGIWLSRGDVSGNFDTSTSSPSMVGCAYTIDFNGDGRADCLDFVMNVATQSLRIGDGTLAGTKAANFNLTSPGQEFASVNASFVPNAGITVADINGDGRQDILRWKDDATQNVVYLSNGDGTYIPSTTFNLGGAGGTPLQNSDGTTSFLIGDFTGGGATEILRLQTVSGTVSNRLFTKADKTPPDQLISVVSGTGLKTDLTWVPLSNSSSGALGPRYSSDRGTANKASYPKLDLSMPMQVVATSISDTGVGSNRITTEYGYAGLKAAYDGRGAQGFRETRRQSPAPDGTNLTVVTQYLQDHPYTGVASTTETYQGTLNALPASPISSSSYTYCEKTAVAGAEALATPTAPCPVPATTKVQRPYLHKSFDEGRELLANGGGALPTVTTVNAFNGAGDPLTITVTTQGTALGTSQNVTKTTNNQYFTDDTSGDNWVLGRLQRASVTSAVPNSLGSISTSPGSAPNASATAGSGVPPPPLSISSVNITSANLTVNSVATFSWSAINATSTSASCSGAVSGSGAGTSSGGSITVTAGSTPGMGTCVATATAGAGSSVTGSVAVNVVVAPSVTANSFSAANVTSGGTVTFSWSATNATSTSASCSGAVSGSGAGTSTGGSITVTAGPTAGTGTCAVTAVNAAGTAAAGSGTVNVVPPPSVTSPNIVATDLTVNSPSTFTWGAANATSTSASCSGAVSGSGTGTSTGGSITVTAGPTPGQGTCVAMAVNAAGATATGADTVNVGNAPNVTANSFGAANVTSSGTVTFSWSATNATSTSASCSGAVSGSGAGTSTGGSITVTAGSTPGLGTCVATATNAAASVTGSSTVNVVPPPSVTGASFSAANVTSGGSVTFSWSTSNATATTVSCSGTASGSGSGPNGSIVVSTAGTGTGTCTVNASNAAGTGATGSNTVNVVPPPSVTGASFSAANVTSGGTVTFSWSTSNATAATVSCSGTASGSGSGLSGSIVVSTAGTGPGTCTVNASNAAGTGATGSNTVNVVPPPSVTGASFSPASVTTGSSSTFSWTTANASSATVACAAPASGAGSGTSGSIAVSTSGTGTGTCTVTAYNAAGSSATGSAGLGVTSPPTTLTSNPTSRSYSVAANGSQTQSFTITNTGAGSATALTLNVSTGGTGVALFSITGGTCAAGGSLAGSSSCTVAVNYSGGCGLSGNNSGTLTVSGTGVGTAATATLSGHYGSGVCY